MDTEELAAIDKALERTCVLQAKARFFIDYLRTHKSAVTRLPAELDRENEALFLVRSKLDLLEDALTEYRSLGNHEGEEKTAAMCALDNARCVAGGLPMKPSSSLVRTRRTAQGPPSYCC